MTEPVQPPKNKRELFERLTEIVQHGPYAALSQRLALRRGKRGGISIGLRPTLIGTRCKKRFTNGLRVWLLWGWPVRPFLPLSAHCVGWMTSGIWPLALSPKGFSRMIRDGGRVSLAKLISS